MGRIKTKVIKRVSLDMVKDNFDKFTSKFEDNKKFVENYAEIRSKKLRNIIAGYVTRLVKSKESI